MEAQRATPNTDKSVRSDKDSVIPSFVPQDDPLSLPRDPIYPEKNTASSPLGDSIEGFATYHTRDSGMSNLENSTGAGAHFQMPEPQTSDNFLNAPIAPEASPSASIPEGTLDVQATVNAIQDLVLRIRENLESPEQEELEELLRQGAEILSSNWKQLSQFTTEQVSTVKSDLKENPYRGVIAALKIGMALSQIYSSRAAVRPSTTASV